MRPLSATLTFVLTLPCAAAGPGLAAETPRPNIGFILIDDQGYYDLGCYGATEFATPHIDAMAAQGVRFTDYYAAAPICSPSRAGLLTGCYPRRIGMETWVQRADSKRGIHPNELTAESLGRPIILAWRARTSIMAIEANVIAKETDHETRTVHRNQRCELSGSQTQP